MGRCAPVLLALSLRFILVASLITCTRSHPTVPGIDIWPRSSNENYQNAKDRSPELSERSAVPVEVIEVKKTTDLLSVTLPLEWAATTDISDKPSTENTATNVASAPYHLLETASAWKDQAQASRPKRILKRSNVGATTDNSDVFVDTSTTHLYGDVSKTVTRTVTYQTTLKPDKEKSEAREMYKETTIETLVSDAQAAEERPRFRKRAEVSTDGTTLVSQGRSEQNASLDTATGTLLAVPFREKHSTPPSFEDEPPLKKDQVISHSNPNYSTSQTAVSEDLISKDVYLTTMPLKVSPNKAETHDHFGKGDRSGLSPELLKGSGPFSSANLQPEAPRASVPPVQIVQENGRETQPDASHASVSPVQVAPNQGGRETRPEAPRASDPSVQILPGEGEPETQTEAPDVRVSLVQVAPNEDGRETQPEAPRTSDPSVQVAPKEGGREIQPGTPRASDPSVQIVPGGGEKETQTEAPHASVSPVQVAPNQGGRETRPEAPRASDPSVQILPGEGELETQTEAPRANVSPVQVEPNEGGRETQPEAPRTGDPSVQVAPREGGREIQPETPRASDPSVQIVPGEVEHETQSEASRVSDSSVHIVPGGGEPKTQTEAFHASVLPIQVAPNQGGRETQPEAPHASDPSVQILPGEGEPETQTEAPHASVLPVKVAPKEGGRETQPEAPRAGDPSVQVVPKEGGRETQTEAARASVSPVQVAPNEGGRETQLEAPRASDPSVQIVPGEGEREIQTEAPRAGIPPAQVVPNEGKNENQPGASRSGDPPVQVESEERGRESQPEVPLAGALPAQEPHKEGGHEIQPEIPRAGTLPTQVPHREVGLENRPEFPRADAPSTAVEPDKEVHENQPEASRSGEPPVQIEAEEDGLENQPDAPRAIILLVPEIPKEGERDNKPEAPDASTAPAQVASKEGAPENDPEAPRAGAQPALLEPQQHGHENQPEGHRTGASRGKESTDATHSKSQGNAKAEGGMGQFGEQHSVVSDKSEVSKTASNGGPLGSQLSDTIHHNTDEGDSSDVNAEIHSPTEAKPSTSHAEENKYLSPVKGESNVNGDTASPNKAEMPETYIEKSIHPPTGADGSKNEDRDSKPGDSHVESSAIVPMEEKSDAGKGSVAILTTPKNSHMPGEGTDKNGSEAAKGYAPDVPLVSGVDEPVAPTHTKGITTEETSTDTIIVVVKPVIQPEPAMEKQNVPQKDHQANISFPKHSMPGVAGPVAPAHITGIPIEAKTDTITVAKKPVIQPEHAVEKPNVPQKVPGVEEPVAQDHTRGIATEETKADTITVVVKPVIQPEPTVEDPNVPQKGEGTDKNGSEAAKGYDPDVPVVSVVEGPAAPTHTKKIMTEETTTDTISLVVKPVIQPEPALKKPNVPQKDHQANISSPKHSMSGVDELVAPTHTKGITTEETTTDTTTLVVKPVIQPEPAVVKPNVPQKGEGTDKNGSEAVKGYDPDVRVVSGVDEPVASTHTKGTTTEETKTDTITVVVKPVIQPEPAVEKPNVPQKGHQANISFPKHSSEGTDKNGSEAAKGFAPDVPVVPGVEGPMAPTHAKGITTEETTTDTMTLVVKPVVQPEPAVAKPNVPQKALAVPEIHPLYTAVPPMVKLPHVPPRLPPFYPPGPGQIRSHLSGQPPKHRPVFQHGIPHINGPKYNTHHVVPRPGLFPGQRPQHRPDVFHGNPYVSGPAHIPPKIPQYRPQHQPNYAHQPGHQPNYRPVNQPNPPLANEPGHHSSYVHSNQPSHHFKHPSGHQPSQYQTYYQPGYLSVNVPYNHPISQPSYQPANQPGYGPSQQTNDFSHHGYPPPYYQPSGDQHGQPPKTFPSAYSSPQLKQIEAGEIVSRQLVYADSRPAQPEPQQRVYYGPFVLPGQRDGTQPGHRGRSLESAQYDKHHDDDLVLEGPQTKTSDEPPVHLETHQ